MHGVKTFFLLSIRIVWLTFCHEKARLGFRCLLRGSSPSSRYLYCCHRHRSPSMYTPFWPFFLWSFIMPQYVPADQPFLPTDELGFLLATFRYQAYFNSNSDAASKELTTDIRRTVRAVLRTVDSPPPVAFLKSNESFLQAWDHVKEVYIVFWFFLLVIFTNALDRSHQYHSSLRKKRITLFHNTKSKI